MLPPFPAPPQKLSAAPRLSIVITNHNYERFLPRALETALGQRDADTEVIVVDDGSTDGSRALLERRGGDVRTILQDNRGQAAAFNAGLAAVSGEIVLFLDADDELEPDIAADVVRAFAAHPTAARVNFRLAVVDEDGRAAGMTNPPARMPLPSGDLRDRILTHPDDLAWPPTSGNAFAAWALDRIFPLPERERTGGDSWLHTLVPLFGPVIALDRIGGSYRLHGRNAHFREQFDLARSRIILSRAQPVHERLVDTAERLGYGRAEPRSVTIAAHRLVSLRLDPASHPFSSDTRRSALTAGLRAAFARRDVAFAKRAAYAAWFGCVAVAPRAAVRAVAEVTFYAVRPRPLRMLLRR
jgi:glycosyltransferase involved in cell wall biosynthesis